MSENAIEMEMIVNQHHNEESETRDNAPVGFTLLNSIFWCVGLIAIVVILLLILQHAGSADQRHYE